MLSWTWSFPVASPTVSHGVWRGSSGSVQPQVSLLSEQSVQRGIAVLPHCELRMCWCPCVPDLRAMCSNSNFSAGGGDGEESGGLPVSSRNAAVAPVYWHGGGLLHCGDDLGVHAHEAQVQLDHVTFGHPLVPRGVDLFLPTLSQATLPSGRIQTCLKGHANTRVLKAEAVY